MTGYVFLIVAALLAACSDRHASPTAPPAADSCHHDREHHRHKGHS